MNRGSGRSYWNRRGGGGRSWNDRSSSDTTGRRDSNSGTNHRPDSEGRSMNRYLGRSSNRRNYSNTNSSNSSSRYGPQESILDSIEEIGTRSSNSISIAIEGCCHGQLTAIYDRLRRYEEDESDTVEHAPKPENDDAPNNVTTEATQMQPKSNRKKIDLLICCGDFQSIRTPADFHSLAVPAKYREMGTFHRYYNEEWVAPVLTIFCGGNHEASQPLAELYYGGWVAPKMYYLGAAGVVRYRGIRIGGLSGIYKSHDHYQSRNETPPYDHKQLRSVYHYRNVDVYRLSCLKTDDCMTYPSELGRATSGTITDTLQEHQKLQPSKRLDIMVSHDWPQGIEQYGNVNDLVRRKPFFRQEINENTLGSPPAAHLLHTIQPSYWFAAHLHVKFHAKVVHRGVSDRVNTISRPSDDSKPSGDAVITGTKNLIPSQVFHTTIRKNDTSANESTLQSTDELKDPFNMPLSQEGNNSNTDPPTAVQTLPTTNFLVPESSLCSNPLPDLTELMTQFLSLDKCLPRRQYLSILHLPTDTCNDNLNDGQDDRCNDSKLEYDLEWLAILRKTHHLAASTHPHRVQLPPMIHSNGREIPPHQVTADDIAWIKEQIGSDMTIPETFTPTLSTQKYDGQNNATQPPPLPRMGNPQTDQLLKLLQLEHLPNLTIPYCCNNQDVQNPSSAFALPVVHANTASAPMEGPYEGMDGDDNEIDLDDDIALPSIIVNHADAAMYNINATEDNEIFKINHEVGTSDTNVVPALDNDGIILPLQHSDDIISDLKPHEVKKPRTE